MAGPKKEWRTLMDVSGSASEVQCYKEQYCIGTWNVRSMSHGKLNVVNQEMAWLNIDILGTSELKWTGMSEFNSDDHYIYYCRQESLTDNKRLQNAVLGCNLKNDRMILVHFLGKSSNITVIQVCAPNINGEEVDADWLWRPTTPSRTKSKRCPFHYIRLECKSRKSRDTQSDRQIWLWSTQ